MLRYTPSAELKALLKGAGKGAVGLMFLYDGYKYATAEDNIDKIIAVADAAGNIMLLIPIPAVQVAGGVLVVGSMAASYVHDKDKEKQKAETKKKQDQPTQPKKKQKPKDDELRVNVKPNEAVIQESATTLTGNPSIVPNS